MERLERVERERDCRVMMVGLGGLGLTLGRGVLLSGDPVVQGEQSHLIRCTVD